MLHVPLPEVIVPGKRLGRGIRHDPRSLAYALPESDTVDSVEWERHIPILDQGNVGSCTGNATVGALGSGPLYAALADKLAAGLVLDERLALAIYSAAETLDGDGPYPPNDNGSSGLSVATVAKSDGYVSGYQHATSVAAAHTAIQAGPFIQGTYWLSGMDSPSSEGIVTATGTVRGGHEYVCRAYDAARDLWWYDNSWGTTFGLQGRFAMSTPTLTTLLAKTGDITSLVPISKPAPTPTPAPTPQPASGLTWTAANADDAATVRAFASKPHWFKGATATAKALKDGTWS